MSDLKDRIKEAAEEVGGLNKLSGLIGVPRRTVGGWVDGSTEPKTSQIAQIAVSTGVAIRWLVLGVGPKFEDDLMQVMRMGAGQEMLQSMGDIKAMPSAEAYIDGVVFSGVNKVVKLVFEMKNVRLPETSLLAETVRRYNELVAETDLADPEEVELRLKLLEKTIARDIAATIKEPSSGKRPA